jgi:hypothetical protein
MQEIPVFKPTKRYRPERHFMRGRGPKWFAKHGTENPLADAVVHDAAGKHLLSFFAQLARTWCRP